MGAKILLVIVKLVHIACWLLLPVGLAMQLAFARGANYVLSPEYVISRMMEIIFWTNFVS